MIRRLALILVLVVGAGVLVSRLLVDRSPGAPAVEKRLYQCSMHPQIVQDRPGTCPICGMTLTPVHGEPAPTAKRSPDADAMPAGDAHHVSGRAPFSLSTERQQLIGVTRGTVEMRDLDIELRAVGRVAYDPELYQAIVEYREAVATRARLKDGHLHEAGPGADAIVRAAALRLRQRGISEAQLRTIAPAGRDPRNLLLPGASVWVYAQVYEYEVGLVKPGQKVVVTTPSAPGTAYTAEVTAIDPILDPATRTARVRILVSTPDGALRPETFVDATIRVPLGHRLALPKSAVLDTGRHRIVFVVRSEGRFEPRAVTLGRETTDYYEVLSGLEAGDEVVTSANFLIDSESRFRAALAGFGGEAPATGHQH
jgi:Cu(I)/Ag(I) efflux system membrane fusion protein